MARVHSPEHKALIEKLAKSKSPNKERDFEKGIIRLRKKGLVPPKKMTPEQSERIKFLEEVLKDARQIYIELEERLELEKAWATGMKEWEK